ncbi:hypothetical protein MAR_037226 [Mya arenaria]|uniref:Uncharacterized protein n=1 Tax=Mya arenaria TaxID=6604 RepID=A0ABY7FN40_MYAAR|nr:hypothetical protein MAR_037226 [Mya arenaria]
MKKISPVERNILLKFITGFFSDYVQNKYFIVNCSFDVFLSSKVYNRVVKNKMNSHISKKCVLIDIICVCVYRCNVHADM